MTEPITFQARFSEAVKLLVGQEPPETLVAAWLAHNNDDLQGWVGSTGGPWWAQSIAILDAAQILADQPIEGESSVCNKRPSVLELEEQLRKTESELLSYRALLNREHRARVALEIQLMGAGTVDSTAFIDGKADHELVRNIRELVSSMERQQKEVTKQSDRMGDLLGPLRQSVEMLGRVVARPRDAGDRVLDGEQADSDDACTCGSPDWESCPHHGKDVLYAEQIERSAYEREDDA